LAYQSGLLESLPGGLAAPRCLLAEEAGPEEVWLWLQDVLDAPGRTWPASRYLVAARHLGGFGGAYLGEQPLPREPWLAEEFFRKRIALAEQEHSLGLFWDRATWEHPLIAGRFSPDVPARLRRLWDARAALLDALDRVPRTLRHGDAHRNNLRANDTPDPHRAEGTRYVTVALDWAALSTGPVGADLSDLAISVLLGPRGYPSPTLPDDLYAAYLGGVRAAGWQGDEAPVRLAYAATMALAGATRLHWAVSMALDGQRRSVLEEGGRNLDAALDAWANAASVCLRYGDEALGRL
jgi:hypothetical protein